MTFNSLEFGVFLALVLSLYFFLSHRAQNRFLLVASYVFYAAWDWRFLGLLIVSTLVDYVVALRLARATHRHTRRALLTVSVCVNLGILGFFKYFGFFTESLGDLLGMFGLTLHPIALHVVLPVGISFYTFQTLSYTIDVYRGDVRPTRNLLDFALYVAFFPQLVAGPIERASHLLPQMLHPRRVTWDAFCSGVWLAFWGLFKKVVIADNLAPLVDAVYGPAGTPTSAEVLLATYAFAYQIYCDFSGYSDIARGVGRMLGFDIMLNFNLPYVAASAADFWHRWHISLSTWLRDYLYIPLGGNRHGAASTYRNLAITMLLGGLWHGASWPFVLWGAYHGALLVAQRAARPFVGPLLAARTGVARLIVHGACVVATFHLVCLGWLMFRAESVADLGRLLTILAGPWDPGLAPEWLGTFVVLVSPLVLMQALQHRAGDLEPVLRWPLAVRASVYVVLFFMIVLLGEDGAAPFIYFQF